VDRRLTLAILLLIAAVTGARIAYTHSVFSPTFDELYHVAAGFEAVRYGQYTIDLQHPPLARMLFACPLRDANPTARDAGLWVAQIYESAGDYMSGVVQTRRGNLVFVVIAIAAVYAWGSAVYGRPGGILSAALFALLPPVLAHGGLATTDMAATASFAVAMAVAHHWLERPTWPRTLALAVAVGIGVTSKFSFPLFFVGALLVLLVARGRYPLVKGLVAAAFAFVLVWGVYLFDYGRMRSLDPETAQALLALPPAIRDAGLPAPGFFAGLMEISVHNRRGHTTYLLGELRNTGWWYYFPLVLGVKTPIPFLLLTAAGVVYAFRQRRHRELIAVTSLLLLIVMSGNINLGVRHVLPLYVPCAILGAGAILDLWTRKTGRIAACALGSWLLANSALAHPDNLAWFNAFAGRHPERIVVDSNLDWGQDLLRLGAECRRLGIHRLSADLFGTARLDELGVPVAQKVHPYAATGAGWYAISETQLMTAQARDSYAFRWLTDVYPYRRVGKSVRLYRVP
jgi:hypothetical protein